MLKAEKVKTFRLCMRREELKFLRKILEEEQKRLAVEQSVFIKKLNEIDKLILRGFEEKDLITTDPNELIVRAILEKPEKELHKIRREFRAELYVRQARLGVVNGFIEHFSKLLEGRLSHGGRPSLMYVEAREFLKHGDGLWFERSVSEDEE